MAKQRVCKGCTFFKKYDNICEFYDSNTYPDTAACSKYKGESDEADEEETPKEEPSEKANEPEPITSDAEGQETKEEPEENTDYKKPKEEPSNSIEDEDLDDVDIQEDASNEDSGEVEPEDDYEEIPSDDAVPPAIQQKDSQQMADPVETRRSKVVEAYTPPRMFSNPFSFHGRIRRTEYGLSLIIYYIYYFIAMVLATLIIGDGIYDYNGEDSLYGLWFILMIPAFWFLIVQGAKRCHDRNNSGWYQLIPFYALWMLFADGDGYENDYGAPPKAFYNGKRVEITPEEDSQEDDEGTTDDVSTSATGSSGDDESSSDDDKPIRYARIAAGVILGLIVIAILFARNNNSSGSTYESADSESTDTVASLDEDTATVDTVDYEDSESSDNDNSLEGNTYSTPPSSSYSSEPSIESTEEYSTDDESEDYSSDDESEDNYYGSDGSDNEYYESY